MPESKSFFFLSKVISIRRLNALDLSFTLTPTACLDKILASSIMETKPHLLENHFLQLLAGRFDRSPRQINHLMEGDSELIRLANDTILAVTTDSIVEEINTGLYSDPRHIGWMTVVVNLSDLAAVGAEVLGILLTHCLPVGFPDEKLEALQSGIADACKATGVFVLGGDYNQAPHWQMGGTGIGWINEGPVITRKGAQPGDILFVSGGMGTGSAFAFQVLMDGDETIHYWPLPRLKEGVLVRHFGSSCIDSSDGFFPAICNLMEINHSGIQLSIPFGSIVHPAVSSLAAANNLPEWIFLAGPHGEFELVFTIPAEKEKAFLEASGQMDWHPVRTGILTEAFQCTQKLPHGTERLVEAFDISNLFTKSGGDPRIYLSNLLKINETWKQQS